MSGSPIAPTSPDLQWRSVSEAIYGLRTERSHCLTLISQSGDVRSLTGSDLFMETMPLAAGLRGLGLDPGERIALMLPEPVDFVPAFLGALLAGLVPVPLAPRAAFRDAADHRMGLQRILSAADVAAMVVPDEAAHAYPGLGEGLSRWRGVVLASSLARSGTPSPEPVPSGPEAACFIQFTSGSTERPRGALITNRNVLANTAAFMGPSGLACSPADVGVSFLPLWHDLALVGFLLGPLIHRIPVVLSSPWTCLRRPLAWLRLIHRFRGTITFAPTFAFALVTRLVRPEATAGLDLSCLRVAGCAGESVSLPVLERFAHLLAATGLRSSVFVPAYGLAEGTLAVTMHPLATPILSERLDLRSLAEGAAARPLAPGAPGGVDVVSCGPPLPGVHVACVDVAGQRLPERRVGEVAIAGPSVSPAYVGGSAEEEASRSDGWLRTGDLGYIAQGRLSIVGRKKEVVILRGSKYHAFDIEAAAVAGTDRLSPVHAFGVMEQEEERLIIVAEGTAQEAVALQRDIAQRVQQALGVPPHRVLIVAPGTLPRTTSGKRRRGVTRASYLAGALDDLATRAGAVSPPPGPPPPPGGSRR